MQTMGKIFNYKRKNQDNIMNRRKTEQDFGSSLVKKQNKNLGFNLS